ncbi:hypothetical protein LNKW23_41740 [Paralimibaculum aggregatum]|uniref:MobA/VirD2-like nuclease domain-containing protein n=1 Tax=Paralimibaculum aggregatum TaxID=3036245 RepID=A0ABQ6LRR9_9RHOB|nr:relaxase [Limibaculum sp. NKW23]GMG84958.1 hypothetical protein LNKW23_41740 [Limibaculum sp. NKW23]
MILVGNQRGGAKNLALHLMKDENERVEIHELRGFASTDLISAFQESYALSRGTRCRQHLFSLSLNPPPEESVAPSVFEDAIARIEAELGLTGQPRAVVFHEKNGRRHAHAVWCRIDADAMRAVPLPFTKRKLQDIARQIYLEQDWRMPRGFVRSGERDPRTYSLAEWQQAKRAKKDPAALKAMFQDCWAISDSRAGFALALRERGYILARGDRRGFVAVDRDGEVYAIARWVGIKTKQVRARLGDADTLPGTQAARAEAAKVVADRLREIREEQKASAKRSLKQLVENHRRLRAVQQAEAASLAKSQARRRVQENAERSGRLRTGLLGLLDRLTGRRKKTLAQIRFEETKAAERDCIESAALERRHSAESTSLQDRSTTLKQSFREALEELANDIRRYERGPPFEAPPKQRRDGRDLSERPRRRRRRDGPRMEP